MSDENKLNNVHKITYLGTFGTGFTWRCTCGAGTSPFEESYAQEYDRKLEAHGHLRFHGQAPKSCRGCCFDINEIRDAIEKRKANE